MKAEIPETQTTSGSDATKALSATAASLATSEPSQSVGAVSSPASMSYEELFNLLKHLDESVHKKETLLLGVSLALVPAVFAAWGSLSPFPTILAAVASICFYWLHGIHIARYSANQDAIAKEKTSCN